MSEVCWCADAEVFQESKLKFRALWETTAEKSSICSKLANGDDDI